MPPIRIVHLRKKIKCVYCEEEKTIVFNKSKKPPIVCDDCHDAWHASKMLKKYKKVRAVNGDKLI